MGKEKFYITTPIYYPSGRFHIGTSYTTTLAHTIKKYRQLRGYDAYMLTGLDEHGQKIQEVAISRGKTPQEHVDEMAENAKELWIFSVRKWILSLLIQHRFLLIQP